MPRAPYLSVTAARDRCHRRSFLSAGLRSAFFPLTDGAILHIWVPSSHPTPSSRPALVLLHGFGACATWQWSPFLTPLIRAGFDLFVPDLLFFGDSSSPSPDRSVNYQARSMMEALVLAGLDHFGMVGVSYGGFVAYQIVAMYPNAVDKLVVVSAGVCLEESDLAAGLFAVSDMAEATSLLVPQQPDDLRRLVKLTFCKPPRFMPTCFIRDYIQVMCTKNAKEQTELLYALINGRKLADVPKINQETLIVWGDQDMVFPLELCHRLKRHLGDNSQVIVIKNVGHAINREKPRELCGIIERYFVDDFIETSERYNGLSHKGYWRDCMRRFTRLSLKRIDSGRPLL